MPFEVILLRSYPVKSMAARPPMRMPARCPSSGWPPAAGAPSTFVVETDEPVVAQHCGMMLAIYAEVATSGQLAIGITVG